MSKLSPFVQSLCEVAFQEARASKPKKQPVEVKDLTTPLFSAWVNFRDSALSCWMDQTIERVPEERLAALLDNIVDLLTKKGIEYPGDAEETTYFVAWAIAVLRWTYKIEAGRMFGYLEYTEDMLQVWLDEAHPQYKQPSLF